MKTFQTKTSNEDQVAKLLFRQLFIFQDQLENKTCISREEELEVEEIICMIDELLAAMIDCYQPEEE